MQTLFLSNFEMGPDWEDRSQPVFEHGVGIDEGILLRLRIHPPTLTAAVEHKMLQF